MKYKSVKDVKREMEEQAELKASCIGLLVLFGGWLYILGMFLLYLIL